MAPLRLSLGFHRVELYKEGAVSLLSGCQSMLRRFGLILILLTLTFFAPSPQCALAQTQGRKDAEKLSDRETAAVGQREDRIKKELTKLGDREDWRRKSG